MFYKVLSALIAFALVFAGYASVKHEQQLDAIAAAYHIVACGSDYDNESCVAEGPDGRLFIVHWSMNTDARLQTSVRISLAAGRDYVADRALGAHNFHVEAMQFVGNYNVETFASERVIDLSSGQFDYTVQALPGGYLTAAAQ